MCILALLCKIEFWDFACMYVFCLFVFPLQGQEIQLNKRVSLATEELQFPVISGFSVQLAINASAAINVKMKGKADFKERSNFFVNDIKPYQYQAKVIVAADACHFHILLVLSTSS